MGEMYVALLRGINVGGANKLPMRELAALFQAAGCTEVRTYIQSGNVVFRTTNATGLSDRLAAAVAAKFGLQVPVILRSAEEMRRALTHNPFVKARLDPVTLHVYFLAEAGSADAVKELDAERSPGDTFVVSEREIYLHLPAGVARTKLTNLYFDRQLGTVSTLRNWRTAVTLGEWMGVV